jgi:hypothetical protein
LPYLDRLEVYHLPAFSPELGGALLGGKLDYARIVDTATAAKAKTTPGMTVATYYQSAINAVWANTQRKPFGDPRVRRALHLGLDRQALIDVVKESWAPPSDELARRLGYQRDPKAAVQEARRSWRTPGSRAGSATSTSSSETARSGSWAEPGLRENRGPDRPRGRRRQAKKTRA